MNRGMNRGLFRSRRPCLAPRSVGAQNEGRLAAKIPLPSGPSSSFWGATQDSQKESSYILNLAA